MKYIEVKFTIPSEVGFLSELIPYQLGELGFESFQQTDEGLLAYIQQQLFNKDTLQETLLSLPQGEVLTYTVQDAEYKDWNEEWESQGFDPIEIEGKIIIHDCIHPVDATPYIYNIVIDAHQAFGTGTHDTTQMMLRFLTSQPSPPESLLDCGCGTGILSIAAMKMGVRRVVGYDIDEWSVENSRHNAELNQCAGDFFLGDASVLREAIEGTFDVVLANINRNILINDVPRFVKMMHADSVLAVSGFYTDDADTIIRAFAEQGLVPTPIKYESNNWRLLTFKLA